VPLLAVLCVTAFLVGAALPVSATRDRFDPRELRHPPLEIVDVHSPLLRIKSQLTVGRRQNCSRWRFQALNADRVRPELVRVATLSGLRRGDLVQRRVVRVARARLDTPNRPLPGRCGSG
jgi:hypothetical protein